MAPHEINASNIASTFHLLFFHLGFPCPPLEQNWWDQVIKEKFESMGLSGGEILTLDQPTPYYIRPQDHGALHFRKTFISPIG